MPTRVRLGAAAAAVALALWLIPASVHIVQWTVRGPSRIALLAPLSRLWWAAATSAAALAAVAIGWRRSGRTLDDLSHRVAPLTLLLTWIVPFLPWLPDRAPALLAFAGPARWAIGAIAVFAAAAGVDRDLLLRAARRATSGPLAVPRIRVVVFAATLAIYAILGLRHSADAGFGGDEPHYLVIAHSLLTDGDLEIGNNHERRDYRAFFPGTLGPDFLRRGRHEAIYSIHAPGLPVLLLPMYALAGPSGAVLTMTLFGALAALAVFDAAASVAGPAAALLAWLAVSFSVPMVPHTWLIYPETAAALIVAWFVRWLVRPGGSIRGLLLQGVTLGVLPWLHTKFVVLLAALAAWALVREWTERNAPGRRVGVRAAALVVPIAMSLGLWLLSFYALYGVFDPQAPYGLSLQATNALANVPRGLLGLLFDQKFGLVVFSPVYLIAATGIWMMARSGRRALPAISLASTAVTFALVTARFYMWWGGSSAPARFLVPTMPLLAPGLAVAIDPARGVLVRGAGRLAIVVSLIVAAFCVASPMQALLFNPPHGSSLFVDALQGPAPLTAIWPTFTEENWLRPARALLPWLAGAAVGTLGASALIERRVLRSSFGAQAVAVAGLALVGGRGGTVRGASRRGDVAVAGRLSLMRALDAARVRVVRYPQLRRIAHEEALAAAALDLRRGDGEDATDAAVAAAYDVPEGQYDVRVWFDGPRAADGTVAVAIGGTPITAPVAATASPVTIPLAMVVSGWISVEASDPATRRAIARVEIVPTSIVLPGLRLPLDARAAGPVAGPPRSYALYTGGNTFPEDGSFWTRDTNEGVAVLVPGRASTLRLILHVGPPGGAVHIDVDGRRRDETFAPNETRELDLPIDPGAARVVLKARAARSFRPSEVDSRSTDNRELGVQVRPQLQ
jgi:hypothetical protein